MKLKLKAGLLATAIALTGVVYMPQASAAVISASPNLINTPGAATFVSNTGLGAFTDWVNFKLSDGGTLSSVATSVSIGGTGVQLSTFELYKGTGAGSVGPLVTTGTVTAAGPAFFGSLYSTALAAGSYTIKVTGNGLDANSFYSGGITVQAVPEPEEWAMMLVGVGLVGYQVRRKQKGLSQSALG